ncbi:MAG TPA: class I SAM-dependent methyltransferase [Mycobacterium sp.]|nr:class I SAM-dependent methyltransferase [Mycobacterium sp.]
MYEPDGYFGEDVAATYDEATADMFDESIAGPAVELLAELAGEDRVLEFGIGTGRIALPLAQRGVEVHGIDLSRAMVSRLHAKPGGAAIGVTIGDFADARVGVPALRPLPPAKGWFRSRSVTSTGPMTYTTAPHRR